MSQHKGWKRQQLQGNGNQYITLPLNINLILAASTTASRNSHSLALTGMKFPTPSCALKLNVLSTTAVVQENKK
jgi:hypothetical protein